MNKSERSHLEAIKNIESVTCQIIESTNFDQNGNLSIKKSSTECCSAFVNDLIACEKCNKIEVN